MSFTVISLIITIALCFTLLAMYVYRREQFLEYINPIETLCTKYDITQTNYGLDSNPILKRITEQYQRSFFKSKTEISAKEYYTIENLSSSNFNLSFYAGYNNTLIGLGILFTFLGLAVGVGYFGYNLSTSSGNQSKAITEGINVLMGGMGAAFASSVLGMFFSLIFIKMYKTKINHISTQFKLISFDLDSRYLKTQADLTEERNQTTEELLEKTIQRINIDNNKRTTQLLGNTLITYSDENGENIGLGSMTKELVIQSRRQSDSLETFSGDLADLFHEASNHFDQNNGNLVKVLEDGFEKLLNSEKDPLEDLMNNLMTELKLTFNKMTTELTSSITTILEGIEDKAGGQVIDTAMEAAQQLDNVTGQLAKLPEVLNQINNHTDQNAFHTKEMIEKVNETINKLHGIIELQGIAASEIKDATSIYADKRSEMNTSLESIKLTSRNLSKSIENIDSNYNKYLNHTNNLEIKRIEHLESATKLVVDSSKMNSDLIENMSQIELSIEGIFEKISTGLNMYHDQISHNTSKELKSYSDNVTRVVEGLHAIVSNLNANIEDLDHQIGTLKKKK